MKVFLSYRRSDVGGYAGRLNDALVDRLGRKNVFQDVTAIAPGRDFAEVIDRALDNCDAVLAVIGPGWLSAATHEGAPRLLEPDDFVRQELTRALKRNVSVVPILVGRARLPAVEDLPSDLHDLVQRQAVVLHDESWHEDVDGLLRSLRGEPPKPIRRSHKRLVGGAVAVTALLLVVITVALLQSGGGSPSGQSNGEGLLSPSEGDKPACEAPTGAGWNPITLGDDVTGEATATDGSLKFTVTHGYWRAVENSQWQVVLELAMRNLTSRPLQVGSGFFSLGVSDREFGNDDMACASTAQEAFVKPNRVGDGRFGWNVTCQPSGSLDLEVSDPNNPQGNHDTIKLTEGSDPSTCPQP